MTFQTTFVCPWCKKQYWSFEGSKFVYRMEKGRAVKRRKCAACLSKEKQDGN